MEQRTAIPSALLLLPFSLCAQWLNFKTPGIPRTADGKPNLTAPAPRAPDGKPDLSGLWVPGPNITGDGGIRRFSSEATGSRLSIVTAGLAAAARRSII
jgi:hypothetical protein